MTEKIKFYVCRHPEKVYIAELDEYSCVVYALRDAKKKKRQEGHWSVRDFERYVGAGDWVLIEEEGSEFSNDSGLEDLI